VLNASAVACDATSFIEHHCTDWNTIMLRPPNGAAIRGAHCLTTGACGGYPKANENEVGEAPSLQFGSSSTITAVDANIPEQVR